MRKTSKALISAVVAIALVICMSVSVYALLDSTMGTYIYSHDGIDYSCNIEKSTSYKIKVAMRRANSGYNSRDLKVEAQVLLSPNTTIYETATSKTSSDIGKYVDSTYEYDKICVAVAGYFYVDNTYIGGGY